MRWHSPNDWIEGDDNNEEESEKLKETTPSPERGGIARAQSHPTDGWEGNDDWGDTDWDSITATEEGNQDTTTKVYGYNLLLKCFFIITIFSMLVVI